MPPGSELDCLDFSNKVVIIFLGDYPEDKIRNKNIQKLDFKQYAYAVASNESCSKFICFSSDTDNKTREGLPSAYEKCKKR
jgi:hypothetical protein